MRRRARRAALVLVALGAWSAQGAAQADTTRSRPDTVRPPADSARRATLPSPAAARAAVPVAPRLVQPPISSRRAFLLSFVVPGLGQTRLDRGTSGALFASVEVSALTLVRRSLLDAAEARRFRKDTLPAEFTARPDGSVQRVGSVPPRYSESLVRLRRLQVEDWLAVVAFNHLIAAADAFVSAQLWDVPLDVTTVPTPRGPVVAARLSW